MQYFKEKTDQKIGIYAFKQLRQILAYHGMDVWGIGPNNREVVPGETVQTDKEILE